MRIGMICHAGCGGSSKIAVELAKHLSIKNAVHLFALHKPYFFDSSIHSEHIVLHELGLPTLFIKHPAELALDWPDSVLNLFLEKIIEVTVKENLDILHFHYAIPFAKIVLSIKKKLKRAPIILGTLHGTDISMHEQFAKQLTEILPQIDLITTVSNNYAELAKTVYALRKKPIVIPNFIDFNEFKMHPANNKADRAFKIIHISNFRPVKNCLQLAEIYKQIQQRIPARLCLIGDGPDMPLLREFFKINAIEHFIDYCGLQPKLNHLIEDADLLLMSSQAESFCLAALEAMASGIPVIAPNVCGLNELIVSGKHGFLYPQNEINYAVECAISLLSNPSQHNKCRIQARQRAQAFSKEKIVPLYEKLYFHLGKRP